MSTPSNRCKTCRGTGVAEGQVGIALDYLKPCPTCHGTGIAPEPATHFKGDKCDPATIEGETYCGSCVNGIAHIGWEYCKSPLTKRVKEHVEALAPEVATVEGKPQESAADMARRLVRELHITPAQAAQIEYEAGLMWQKKGKYEPAPEQTEQLLVAPNIAGKFDRPRLCAVEDCYEDAIDSDKGLCAKHADPAPEPQLEGDIKTMLDNTILDWDRPSYLITSNANQIYDSLIPAIAKLLAAAKQSGAEQFGKEVIAHVHEYDYDWQACIEGRLAELQGRAE